MKKREDGEDDLLIEKQKEKIMLQKCYMNE